LRLAFAGTPEFARAALAALHAAGHDISLVLTQPDRPAGRGMKLQASPVKQFAQEHSISLAQPRSLRLDGKYPEDAAAAHQALLAAPPDVMVVAAYGLILPQWVLDLLSDAGPPQGAKAPSGGSEARAAASVGARKWGCLNIHASLLPRWRGAAPIHRAVEAGDAQTGITLMQMDAGLDTGDMLAVEAVPISPTDTTGSLHDRLADLGACMIVQALARLEEGAQLPSVKQPEAGISYAHKIEKHEAALDWTQPAEVIARRIHAFNPFPGASTTILGETVKIWDASPQALAQGTAPCGTVLRADADGVLVCAGEGGVNLTQLQRPGGKRLTAAEFLRGFTLPSGTVLGAT
jgi:methionyl-tRNA formyltransferase